MKVKRPIFKDDKEKKLFHIAINRRFDKLRVYAKEKREYENQENLKVMT